MSRRVRCAFVLAGAMGAMAADARAVDDTKYPDLKGQWVRIGPGTFDPAKGAGREQRAPLTPEYQDIFEARRASEQEGGDDFNPITHCLPAGMPRTMVALEPLEIMVTPETTYILVSYFNEFRRVYTDGRSWPETLRPSFTGYSIGKWDAPAGGGQYEVLEIETRGMKGPRIFEGSGIPLHADNQTIVKERLYLDQANSNILHDEITTIDHALTRPWTVIRSYRRDRNPTWIEWICTEHNNHLFIQGTNYFISAEGYLMPARRNQGPPDLRNFQQPQN